MYSPPPEKTSKDILERQLAEALWMDFTTDTSSEKSLKLGPHNEDWLEAELALAPQASRESQQPSLPHKGTFIGTTGTSDPNFEVDWEGEDDPENPRNWSVPYRGMVLAFLSWNTLVV